MKHICLILLALALPALAQATTCSAYLPTETGTVMEQTLYNKKGKVQGRNVQELILIEEKGKETHFTVHQESFSAKGKPIYENDLMFKCVDDTFYIDMSSFLNSKQMDSYEDMDVAMTMEEIDIPVDAKPGQILKDGSLYIQVAAGNMPINMNITINVINRKVETREKITTPAGTFDCLKITQDIVTKSIMTFTARSVEWYAKDVGAVKTETYNKKGKLLGYNVLTRLEKPSGK